MKATPSTERASRLSMNMLCLLLLQCIHPSTFSARGTFRPMGIFFLPAAFLMVPDRSRLLSMGMEVSGWQTGGQSGKVPSWAKTSDSFIFSPRKETLACLSFQTSISLSFYDKYIHAGASLYYIVECWSHEESNSTKYFAMYCISTKEKKKTQWFKLNQRESINFLTH